MPTAEVCRRHDLSPATFYKLKAKYGGMEVSEVARLKALEDENAKLKRLLPKLDVVTVYVRGLAFGGGLPASIDAIDLYPAGLEAKVIPRTYLRSDMKDVVRNRRPPRKRRIQNRAGPPRNRTWFHAMVQIAGPRRRARAGNAPGIEEARLIVPRPEARDLSHGSGG